MSLQPISSSQALDSLVVAMSPQQRLTLSQRRQRIDAAMQAYFTDQRDNAAIAATHRLLRRRAELPVGKAMFAAVTRQVMGAAALRAPSVGPAMQLLGRYVQALVRATLDVALAQLHGIVPPAQRQLVDKVLQEKVPPMLQTPEAILDLAERADGAALRLAATPQAANWVTVQLACTGALAQCLDVTRPPLPSSPPLEVAARALQARAQREQGVFAETARLAQSLPLRQRARGTFFVYLAQHLSPHQLDAAHAFENTPAGRAFVASMQSLMQLLRKNLLNVVGAGDAPVELPHGDLLNWML